MNKLFLFLGVLAILCVAAWWYLPERVSVSQWQEQELSGEMQEQQVSTQMAPYNPTPRPGTLGSYSYECDEHVTFVMTPASDMASILIEPLNNPAYPPTVTLKREESVAGARYEGDGIRFVGHGETVTLNEGESMINCSPIPMPGEAPFNFGDVY